MGRPTRRMLARIAEHQAAQVELTLLLPEAHAWILVLGSGPAVNEWWGRQSPETRQRSRHVFMRGDYLGFRSVGLVVLHDANLRWVEDIRKHYGDRCVELPAT